MPVILIVDDKPDNLLLLTEILVSAGYEVRQVKTGNRALEIAASDPPDLILLDIRMPNMDGYEVCRKLKQRKDLSIIPVIFLTALSDTIDKVQAFTVGGVDYVTKPFDPDEVLARVKTHLEINNQQKRLRRELRDLQEVSAPALPAKQTSNTEGIQLSKREKECLMWLSQGLRNDRIAEKMGIKTVTVQLHLDKARKRLDAATREQALTIAIQIGALNI